VLRTVATYASQRHAERLKWVRQATRLCDHRAMLESHNKHAKVSSLADADRIDGAVKAFAVLESFTAERQRLNVTQIAERAGLSRAAARRHALTLQALGYVDGEDGVYWLSHRVLRLAGSYLAAARLPRVAQPVLNRLAALNGLALSVAVLDGAEVVIVARSGEHRLSGSVLPYGVHLGARLAAHATSTGRVLLAALPAGELAHWLAAHHGGSGFSPLTPFTLTARRAWLTMLKQVRTDGYAETQQEHELGVTALAVPLTDSRNRVIAALNIVQTSPRMARASGRASAKTAGLGAQLVDEYLPALQSAAAELRLVL
jgi:IclR family transcriptional regulator, pca regulon regulatory protein